MAVDTTTHVELLKQQLDEAQRRAESLRRVIELVSSELALEPLLTRIVESATDLIGATFGSIGLVKERPDGPVVQTLAVVNLPPDELGDEIPIDVGLTGKVLREQRPIRVDRYEDLDRPRLKQFTNYAAIGIPIRWAQRMIGVFAIAAEPPRRFTDQDVETLSIFARHAAIAIENARLFEAEQRRTERIAILNRIGRLMTSSLSFDTLFQTAIEAIRENFRFAYVSAAVIAPDDPESVILLAHAGINITNVPTGYRQSVYDGVIGIAARTRQRVLVNDVTKEPHYISVLKAPSICAELAIPIVVGDRLLGVINIESDRAIDAEEIESLEIIADQFGAALENARLFGEVQQALQTTRLMYEASHRISTAMSVEEVVAVYLDQVAARGRYACTVVLYETDQNERRTGVMVIGRWSPQHGASLDQFRLPYNRDGLDAPLDAGRTVTIADVHTDPRASDILREIQRRDRRPALAMIPLMVRGRRIGLVILSYPQVHEWVDADLEPYQATAAQLAMAIDSRRQYLLLSERGQQIAVLEERRRLARELHDSVTQSLFSMSLLAQVIPDLWDVDRDEARRSLEQIRDMTRGALAEMRALLFELRPTDGTDHDLARGLRALVRAFEQRTGASATVEIRTARLPADVEHALLRIAQEALNNIAKHAHARRVFVSLQGGTTTRLVIADNGRGFQPDQVGAGSFGLISMRERAANINAQLKVHSAIGQGTEIVIEWPAEANAGPLAGS